MTTGLTAGEYCPGWRLRVDVLKNQPCALFNIFISDTGTKISRDYFVGEETQGLDPFAVVSTKTPTFSVR